MPTTKTTVPLSLQLETELFDMFEEFRARYDPPLSKTDAFRTLIVHGFESKKLPRAIQKVRALNLD